MEPLFIAVARPVPTHAVPDVAAIAISAIEKWDFVPVSALPEHTNRPALVITTRGGHIYTASGQAAVKGMQYLLEHSLNIAE